MLINCLPMQLNFCIYALFFTRFIVEMRKKIKNIKKLKTLYFLKKHVCFLSKKNSFSPPCLHASRIKILRRGCAAISTTIGVTSKQNRPAKRMIRIEDQCCIATHAKTSAESLHFLASFGSLPWKVSL